MAQFVIPTIFSAIDKFSSPVRSMMNHTEKFAGKVEGAIGRSERAFRKVTPVLGDASKELLSFASTAAAVGAVVGGVSYSVKALEDYETAVASFRTIVGGSDKEFKPFQDQINAVARDTKKSSIDTAAAFEKIAGLNAKFADTAEHIGQVSKAAITLSKASGDELGPSAESLVGIMNQFSLQASQADRTINVLAAGAGVGASSIVQTADAFTTFGSTAAGANISLEQSVALVQTLGKFSIFGSEAGNQLKGTLLRLQASGAGYKSGVFQINDALEETKKKFDKLRTAKEKDAFLDKTFGAINIGVGRTLLNNIDLYKEYTKGVTNTTQAQEQAAIRSNTLTTKIDELKNAWINMVTGNAQAGSAAEKFGNVIVWVTEHLETILKVIGYAVGAMLAWKVAIMVSKGVMIGYNVVLGIMNALDTTSVMLKSENTIAQAAYMITTKAITGVLWLAEAAQAGLNLAMSLNPVAAVVIAVMALVAALGYLIANYKSVQALHDEGIQKKRSQSYNDEAKQIEFLASRYEKYGSSKEEAMKKSLKESQANLKYEYAAAQTQSMNAKTDEEKRLAEDRMADLRGKAEAISTIAEKVNKGENPFADAATKNDAATQAGNAQEAALGTDGVKELVNPKAAHEDRMVQKMEKTNKEELKIIVEGNGAVVGTESTSPKHANIVTTSTMGLQHK